MGANASYTGENGPYTEDCYALLGLSRTATHEEVRHAYRAAMRECHPDVRAGGHERAVRLNAAYEILGDPLRRPLYDRTLPEVPAGTVSSCDPGIDDAWGAGGEPPADNRSSRFSPSQTLLLVVAGYVGIHLLVAVGILLHGIVRYYAG